MKFEKKKTIKSNFKTIDLLEYVKDNTLIIICLYVKFMIYLTRADLFNK